MNDADRLRRQLVDALTRQAEALKTYPVDIPEWLAHYEAGIRLGMEPTPDLAQTYRHWSATSTRTTHRKAATP